MTKEGGRATMTEMMAMTVLDDIAVCPPHLETGLLLLVD
jgi:hypothetical protein